MQPGGTNAAASSRCQVGSLEYERFSFFSSNENQQITDRCEPRAGWHTLALQLAIGKCLHTRRLLNCLHNRRLCMIRRVEICSHLCHAVNLALEFFWVHTWNYWKAFCPPPLFRVKICAIHTRPLAIPFDMFMCNGRLELNCRIILCGIVKHWLRLQQFHVLVRELN